MTDHRICLVCNGEFEDSLRLCPNDGTPLLEIASTPPRYNNDFDLPDKLVDHHGIESCLLKNSHSTIYKGAHPESRDIPTVIRVHWHYPTNEQSLRKWMDVFRTIMEYDHENIVKTFDFGIYEDTLFDVQQFVEGENLLQVMRKNSRPSLADILSLCRQACVGLDYLHSNGRIHPDLRPSHIMISGEKVTLIDFREFDFRRSNETMNIGERIFLSPHCVAPEQFLDKPAGVQSNVYSLGCTLFWWITGRPPFDGKNEMQVASRHLCEPLPAISDVAPSVKVPEHVEGVIKWALSKDPKDRPATMQLFLDELELTGASGDIEYTDFYQETKTQKRTWGFWKKKSGN